MLDWTRDHTIFDPWGFRLALTLTLTLILTLTLTLPLTVYDFWGFLRVPTRCISNSRAFYRTRRDKEVPSTLTPLTFALTLTLTLNLILILTLTPPGEPRGTMEAGTGSGRRWCDWSYYLRVSIRHVLGLGLGLYCFESPFAPCFGHQTPPKTR